MLVPSHDQPAPHSVRTRSVRIAAAFLAISYGIGAPTAAFLEFQKHLISERFHYPVVFIYFVCVVQSVCAVMVLVRQLAPWAAAALTVTTLGAVASHIRIGSPLTALPALVYTVIQVWFGLRSRER